MGELGLAMATNRQLAQSLGESEHGPHNSQDPLNLGEYMMSDQRSPRIETLLQQTESPSIASSSSPTVLSTFNDYPQFQNQQRSYSGFSNSLRMQSPKQGSGQFPQPRSGSIA